MLDEANKETSQVQNVSFLNQGQEVQDQSLALTQQPRESYINEALEDVEHNINDFLERPVRVWNGSFSTSQQASDELVSLRLPDILLQNPMIMEKVRGFVGLRADCEITVQVNAQKFQQGRLRLQYIPYAKYLPNKASIYKLTLTSITSCPGVDIDICGGSNQQTRVAQAVFKIPYVSPHLYFNLINGDGTMGDIRLVVYSPLKSGTNEETKCEVTVWARFVNPTLKFPTGAEPHYSVVRMNAQVRGEAQQIAQTGVLSTTMGKVAETLKTARKIPLIGSYLATPEWLANTATNVLKMFGFSKPTVTIDTKLRTTNCFANFNGKDSSHKLALSAENEIDTPAGLASTNLDEMALMSIASVPAWYTSFNWKTSDTVTDQILWRDRVTPLKVVDIQAKPYFNVPPVSYIANCFGYWRGSIIFTFKVVKTGFHTGRLRIFYTPGESESNVVVGSAPSNQIEKNYQIIFDIDESDTCSFSVPYVSTKPWRALTPQSSGRNPVSQGSGLLVVTVLNELRAVSTVSDTIEVLVEISAGKDLTFACPCAPRVQPMRPLNDHTLNNIPNYHQEHHSDLNYNPTSIQLSNSIKMEAQVFGTAVQAQRNAAQRGEVPDSISLLEPSTNWSPEAHCIGEKIVSIRQLIKRNNCIGMTWEYRSIDNKGIDEGVNYWNNLNGLTVINPYANKINDQINGIDYLSYFDTIFAFFRGGIRLKIFSQVSYPSGLIPTSNSWDSNTWLLEPKTNKSLMVRMFNAYDQYHGVIRNNTARYMSQNNALGLCGINATDILSYDSLTMDAASSIIVNQNIEGMVEVEVPYYNSTHMSPNDLIIRTSNDPTLVDPTQIFPGTGTTDDAYPIPIIMVTTPITKTKGQIRKHGSSADSKLDYESAMAATYQIYRSAADDFSFNYFIGVPPMVLGDLITNHVFKPNHFRIFGPEPTSG